MKMPQLHSSKKEAILQLCNILCTRGIEKITELADGEILVETIKARCPDLVKDSDFNFNVEDVKTESLDVTESNESNNTSVKDENMIDPAIKNTDINFKLNYIEKFIDDCYGIKSCEIISYVECSEKKELEIYKVVIFVFSELIQHLMGRGEAHLQTLYHLDNKYQMELEDILKLFITQRHEISKDVVEKILSKSAAKSSPFLTPSRHSPRRKQMKNASQLTPKEDVFSNSPLKEFFESPVVKENVLMKNRTIKNLTELLEKGEEELAGLRCELDEERKVSRSELSKKEKLIENLQKNLKDTEEEVKELMKSCQSESCVAEREKLIKSYRDAEYNSEFQTQRVIELTSARIELEKKITLLERTLKETEKVKFLHTGIGVQTYAIENERLKNHIKFLELKIFGYKKQLSEKILTELKAKDCTGNLNRTYEDVWAEVDKSRREHEENVAFIIEEDNRRLLLKNQELTEENNKLLKKIENLQEKKTFTSIAIETDLPILKPEIFEIEKFRNLGNHSKYVEDCTLPDETLCNLNNSDDFRQSEQPIILPKSEMPSEAVLWKNFDINLETENTEVSNVSQGSLPENPDLDVTSNLEVENIESDLSQENKYVFGNLNFNAFLIELKKLTKNGSFQKVLQIFEKIRKTKGATNANNIGIQELLKIITECICTVVSLNSRSPVNLQDKSSLTDENVLNKNIKQEEIEKLDTESQELNIKQEEIEKLDTESQELNIKQEEIEKLDTEKLDTESQELEKELKISKEMLEESSKIIAEMESKHQEWKTKAFLNEKQLNEIYARYKEAIFEAQKLKKKSDELKLGNSDLVLRNKRYSQQLQEVKAVVHDLSKRKSRTDHLNKLLKEQNRQQKQELQKLKENMIKLRERELVKSDMQTANLDSRESLVGESSYFSLTECHPNISQDTANESTLSGALHKNLSYYVSENEDDFVWSRRLEPAKHSLSECRRVEELKRRNSLLPIHLQSAYPIEANLNAKYESLYVTDDDKYKEENCCKKRKLDDPILEEQPSTSFQRNFKISQKFKSSTPKGLSNIVKKVCNNAHNTLSKKHKK